MRSVLRPAPMRLLLLLSIASAVSACAGTRPLVMTPDAFSCAALVPDSYRHPVKSTPLPSETASQGQLWTSLDDQTARLDQANGKTADVLSIADQCEAEKVKARAAVAPKRPWWKVWGK